MSNAETLKYQFRQNQGFRVSRRVAIIRKLKQEDFPVCDPCNSLFLKYKNEENWKNQIDSAEQHPLVISRNVLNEIEECIKRALPKYEETVIEIKGKTFPATVEVMPDICQVREKQEALFCWLIFIYGRTH